MPLPANVQKAGYVAPVAKAGNICIITDYLTAMLQRL
jgi:hypothetical protein